MYQTEFSEVAQIQECPEDASAAPKAPNVKIALLPWYSYFSFQ